LQAEIAYSFAGVAREVDVANALPVTTPVDVTPFPALTSETLDKLLDIGFERGMATEYRVVHKSQRLGVHRS
jgi:hypothetical protein